MYNEYVLRNLVNSGGSNRYRHFSILKNSYGVDDVSFGLRFWGEVSNFETLPKADDLNAMQSIYNQIRAEVTNDLDVKKYINYYKQNHKQ